MKLTIGDFHGVIEFCEIVYKVDIKEGEISKIKQSYYSKISFELVLNITQTMDIIRTDTSGILVLDKCIADLFEGSAEYYEIVRLLLKKYIQFFKPKWCFQIPSGRAEFFNSVSDGVVQLFEESGLSENTRSDVIKWWDEVSEFVRSNKDGQKLSTGRLGEEITLSYEYKRIGVKPIWQAIESNRSGFDVLSQVSPSDKTQMPIEVKASTLPVKQAKFFLTRNEWNVLQSNKHFNIYLLSIYEDLDILKLCVIKKEDVVNHIPLEQGKGRWENVGVPFRPFFNQLNYEEVSLSEMNNMFNEAYNV